MRGALGIRNMAAVQKATLGGGKRGGQVLSEDAEQVDAEVIAACWYAGWERAQD